VFALDPPRVAPRAVPALDPARRRLALARGPDGALYVTYFIVEPHSRSRGGIARLELDRGETDAITSGLGKPVGVAASASTLYVADAEQRAIFAYSLADLSARRTVARELAAADLLTLLPDGDLVTGGGGAVQRITASGRVVAIADGFEQVRGTAYDEARRRLFVVEHSVASSRHRLHVLPLP
jgi:sugar lactone lactonase YvrE